MNSSAIWENCTESCIRRKCNFTRRSRVKFLHQMHGDCLDDGFITMRLAEALATGRSLASCPRPQYARKRGLVTLRTASCASGPEFNNYYLHHGHSDVFAQ